MVTERMPDDEGPSGVAGADRLKPVRTDKGRPETGRAFTDDAEPRLFAGATCSACTSSLESPAPPPPFATVKNRLPMPFARLALSVATIEIVCWPFVSVVVSRRIAPMAPRPASRFRNFVGFEVRGVFG